jgi:hypothetical protein
MLKEYAQIGAVDAKSVTLAFKTPAIGRQFEAKAEFFRDALREIVGVDLLVRVGAGAEPAAEPSEPTTSAAGPTAETDVVDLTDDDDDHDQPDAAVDAPADAVALLQSELSAQVIERIDGS